MKTDGEIGCGWGSTMSGIGGDAMPTHSWSLQDWKDNVGFRIKREQSPVADEMACCKFAMSFEGTKWSEGGSAVRFQFSNGQCRVDRETMMRGNLDRSSGLALRDTTTCGTGVLYWRHATGSADAANLKAETKCQVNNGFKVLARTDMSAYAPVGSLPDHFIGNWGNELPNHICPNWPHGNCEGVIGYNTIASPEECCEACVSLKWVEEMSGDVSRKADGTHENPCVAWQVVGGKCRIMREKNGHRTPELPREKRARSH